MPDFNLIAARAECVAEALRNLYRSNASPVAAIKALVEGRGLSLRDAKLALIDSPAWKVEATAAIELHEQSRRSWGGNPSESDRGVQPSFDEYESSAMELTVGQREWAYLKDQTRFVPHRSGRVTGGRRD